MRTDTEAENVARAFAARPKDLRPRFVDGVRSGLSDAACEALVQELGGAAKDPTTTVDDLAATCRAVVDAYGRAGPARDEIRRAVEDVHGTRAERILGAGTPESARTCLRLLLDVAIAGYPATGSTSLAARSLKILNGEPLAGATSAERRSHVDEVSRWVDDLRNIVSPAINAEGVAAEISFAKWALDQEPDTAGDRAEALKRLLDLPQDLRSKDVDDVLRALKRRVKLDEAKHLISGREWLKALDALEDATSVGAGGAGGAGPDDAIRDLAIKGLWGGLAEAEKLAAEVSMDRGNDADALLTGLLESQKSLRLNDKTLEEWSFQARCLLCEALTDKLAADSVTARAVLDGVPDALRTRLRYKTLAIMAVPLAGRSLSSVAKGAPDLEAELKKHILVDDPDKNAVRHEFIARATRAFVLRFYPVSYRNALIAASLKQPAQAHPRHLMAMSLYRLWDGGAKEWHDAALAKLRAYLQEGGDTEPGREGRNAESEAARKRLEAEH